MMTFENSRNLLPGPCDAKPCDQSARYYLTWTDQYLCRRHFLDAAEAGKVLDDAEIFRVPVPALVHPTDV
jgi:hypothetical protein